MKHILIRCAHCQKLYTYCTYGNGPEYGTDEGCSRTYCAECQKAIDAALDAIPVKFRPVQVEIHDDSVLVELDRIKKKFSELDDGMFPQAMQMVCDEYSNIDKFTYDGSVYYVKYNDKSPDDRHLFVEMEYDILNEKVTDRYWGAESMEETYQKMRAMNSGFVDAEKVKPFNLSEPHPGLFYCSF